MKCAVSSYKKECEKCVADRAVASERAETLLLCTVLFRKDNIRGVRGRKRKRKEEETMVNDNRRAQSKKRRSWGGGRGESVENSTQTAFVGSNQGG